MSMGGLARGGPGRRRWFQAAAVAGQRVAVVSVAEHGATASAWVWMAELDTGRGAWDERLDAVGPEQHAIGPFSAAGCEAHVTTPRLRIRLARRGGPWELTVHAPGCALSWVLEVGGARDEPLDDVLAARQADGEQFAQRLVGLTARGSVRLRSEVIAFEPTAPNALLELADVSLPGPVAWTSAAVLSGAGRRLPTAVAGASLPAGVALAAGVPGFLRRAGGLEVVRRAGVIAMRHELVAGVLEDLDGAIGLVAARSFA